MSFNSFACGCVLTASLLTLSCSSSSPTSPSSVAGGSLTATERRVDAVRGDTAGGVPEVYVTLLTASGDTLVLHCGLTTSPLLRIGQCSITESTGRLEGTTVFEWRFTLQSVSDSEMQLMSQLLIPRLGGQVYAIAGNLVGGTVTSSTSECAALNDVTLTGSLEQLGRVTVTFAYCATP